MYIDVDTDGKVYIDGVLAGEIIPDSQPGQMIRLYINSEFSIKRRKEKKSA